MGLTERRPLRQIIMPYFTVFDGPLALIMFLILSVGIVTLYSAGIDFPGRVEDQLRNILIAFVVMWIAAIIPPQTLMRFAVPIYTVGVALLVAVAVFGMVKKGARRWLNVGVVIQPSEVMKIAMPLMLAWFFQKREGLIRWQEFMVAAILLVIPVGLIAKQPDLGTAILVLAAGFYVITRLLSENALWDTITALGLMICFYYGLTALACVWYFRGELFDNARNFFCKFLAPLIGGIVLTVLLWVLAYAFGGGR